MDILSGMVVFAKVGEKQSFTAAARDLKLSKSAVSKQIQRLEERLGVRLLNRTTRRLHLTESGQAFYERARRVVEEAEQAEQAVSMMHGQPRGTLRINAPMSFGLLHLAPCLPDFMRRYPDLDFDISYNDRQVDLIDDGFDIGIRIASLNDSSYIARRLSPARLAVVATPAYWDRHGRPQYPEDLAQHECLIYEKNRDTGFWPFQRNGEDIRIPVSGRMRADNGEALLDLALAGLGAYMCPTFISGQHIISGKLEQVLAEFEPNDISIYAIWPHNRHLSAKVRAFVDFLVERFGPKPYWDCELLEGQRR